MLSVSLAATTGFSQVKYGFQAGAVYSSLKTKAGSVSHTASTFGPTAGILADIPINENLVFQPSVNYVQKGGKSSDDMYKTSTSIHYIEVPLNMLYRINSEGSSFFIGLGPVISPAISGKSSITYMDETISEKIDFGSDEDEMKRLEFSGNVFAGYEFSNGLFVSAGYNQGISNLLNDSDDVTLRNSFIAIKVGFKLGSK